MTQTVQDLVDILARDAQRALTDYERARQDDHEPGMDARAQHLAGLRVGLGRVLAWRDGVTGEGVVSAFNRGRDYQDAQGVR